MVKLQGGLVSITLKPETLKVRALSMYVCSRLESDLDDMTDEDTQSKVVATHKQTRGRGGIRHKLSTCVDALDSATQPSGIVNGQWSDWFN